MRWSVPGGFRNRAAAGDIRKGLTEIFRRGQGRSGERQRTNQQRVSPHGDVISFNAPRAALAASDSAETDSDSLKYRLQPKRPSASTRWRRRDRRTMHRAIPRPELCPFAFAPPPDRRTSRAPKRRRPGFRHPAAARFRPLPRAALLPDWGRDPYSKGPTRGCNCTARRRPQRAARSKSLISDLGFGLAPGHLQGARQFKLDIGTRNLLVALRSMAAASA